MFNLTDKKMLIFSDAFTNFGNLLKSSLNFYLVETLIPSLFVKAISQDFRIFLPFFEIVLSKFTNVFEAVNLMDSFLPKSKHGPIQDFNGLFYINSFTELGIINIFKYDLFAPFIDWINFMLNNIFYFSRLLLDRRSQEIKYERILTVDMEFL